MKPDIDPVALLNAHQQARAAGMRMVSVLVGPPSRGRATFGSWICGLKDSRSMVVAPEPTYDAAKRALTFASGATALMIIPAKEQLTTAAAAAFNIADDDRAQPIALVTDFVSFEALMKDLDVSEAVRHMAFGGLVPLQETALNKMKALDPSPKPPAPYRSHHEYLLHTLMTHDQAIGVTFQVNRRVPGASWKKYEIDLWCAELKFAVEVDGSQHVGSPKQVAWDCARDADLTKAGIKTRRVLASAIMSDPTGTLKLIRDEIAARASEIVK